MDTQSLMVSNAALGVNSGRNKVHLKPRHSLMDWIRYTNSGKDLTSTGGKTLNVSLQELAKHNTKEDAWIALKGKVYNITPYLDYHPGGVEELMRGAGKDATDLFNQIHRWVNAESMLQKCFVGFLKRSWSLEAQYIFKKASKNIENSKSVPQSNLLSSKDSISNAASVSESSCVAQSSLILGDAPISLSLSSEGKKIELMVLSSQIKLDELITELNEALFLMKLNKHTESSWLKINLPSSVASNYEVKLPQESAKDKLEVSFYKEKAIASEGSTSSLIWNHFIRDESNIFWPSKLIKKSCVNHNTYVFTFLLPPNVKMWIPIGYHIALKTEIEGMELVRSYTPVMPFNSEDDFCDDGTLILLLIKIYPSGTLTPVLNLCEIGENLLISCYQGTFSENLIEKSDFVLIVAAGSGITPMIKIIRWILTAEDKKRSVLLLFFNKTEEDIIWRSEFEECCKKWDNFQVIHVLSEPDSQWSGFTGTINEDLLQATLPQGKNKLQILICGPIKFTECAVKLFEKVGFDQSCIFTFAG